MRASLQNCALCYAARTILSDHGIQLRTCHSSTAPLFLVVGPEICQGGLVPAREHGQTDLALASGQVRPNDFQSIDYLKSSRG